MFEDRREAGRLLAKQLTYLKGQDAVVLALPRGGVVLGYEIAKHLALPLDIVVTRKIGHPGNPEYAVCAIDERGMLLCNEDERKALDARWFKGEAERQRKEAERRALVYREGRETLSVEGKTAVLVDDGIATGLTMRLAILGVRAQKPAKIIVAVPVAPSDVVRTLKREADEFIVLLPPEDFAGAVGAHFRYFEQVKDEEVIKLLKV